ncbi:MAG: protein-glutamate O-methyltransferase CheR [Pseudomonadota bacterium]
MSHSAAAPVGSAAKMTDEEFRRFAALVNVLTGIVIKEHKREMIHSRISRRLRACNMSSFAEYLTLVEGSNADAERGELINAVTTNLTAFFREAHHFDHLRDHMLAEMAAAKQSRVRIWSSASSSGEEPYSIAMTVADSRIAQTADVKVLATDLDTDILARAAAGRYPADRVKPIPEGLRRKAFVELPGGEFEARDEVKRFLTFRRLNLLEEWPMSGPFDVIFCRNVLIYFDSDVKRGIVERMARLLRPGGALYLGHSESLLGDHPLLLSEGKTIYRRKA